MIHVHRHNGMMSKIPRDCNATVLQWLHCWHNTEPMSKPCLIFKSKNFHNCYGEEWVVGRLKVNWMGIVSDVCVNVWVFASIGDRIKWAIGWKSWIVLVSENRRPLHIMLTARCQSNINRGVLEKIYCWWITHNTSFNWSHGSFACRAGIASCHPIWKKTNRRTISMNCFPRLTLEW